MLAYSFNAALTTPEYGGGSGGLPPGKYKGVILDITKENVEKNGQITGGFLAFKLVPIEGPLANTGASQIDRLNIHNPSPKATEIANKQLSAYCHVLGKYQIEDLHVLLNIPFYFEVAFQKGQEPTPEKPNGGYTQVVAIADINGNEPGKGNAGAVQQQQPAQQPAQMPAQMPAGGVTAGTAGAGAGWGQPAAQQQQPQVDNGVAMPAQQPAAQGGGAWGQPAAQQGGAAQGGAWGAR